MLDYFAEISQGMLILWCYMIWYCYFVYRYFDPSPDIWIRSIGISIFVGIALNLNAFGSIERSLNADPYVVFRFFLIPFCVSSFPALLKGKGFLIFSRSTRENLTASALCALFVGFSLGVKWMVI